MLLPPLTPPPVPAPLPPRPLECSANRDAMVEFLDWALSQPNTWAVTYKQVRGGGLKHRPATSRHAWRCGRRLLCQPPGGNPPPAPSPPLPQLIDYYKAPPGTTMEEILAEYPCDLS